MSESLDTLFRCEYFGRDLLRKHCLRRQLECQEALVTVRESPRGTPVPPHERRQAGPPVHGHCASGKCEQGRDVRALFPDLELGICGTCGTALVGVTACPTCAARAADAKPPHVLPAKREPSERIWKENLPEAPFVPPATKLPDRTPSPGERVAGVDRVHTSSGSEAAPHGAGTSGIETAPARTERAGRRDSAEGGPPTPAAAATPLPPRAVQHKEDEMPKGLRPGGPCKGCGSKGNRHIGNCPEAGKKLAKVPKLRVPRSPAQRRRDPERQAVDFDPVDLTDEQLADCVQEARDRRTRIQREAAERLAKLGQVLKGIEEAATGTDR